MARADEPQAGAMCRQWGKAAGRGAGSPGGTQALGAARSTTTGGDQRTATAPGAASETPGRPGKAPTMKSWRKGAPPAISKPRI